MFIHTKSCVPGWFSPAYKSQLCTLFSSFIFECHTGSLKLAIAGVFTPWKLENASNQSFLLPGSQFLKFINILLLTYHSIEIILVKATHDLKVAKSNMYFYLLFIWTLSHIWYSDHFFLLEMLSSTGLQGTSFSWFSSYFIDHSFLGPWHIFFFISPTSEHWIFQDSILRILFFSIYTHFQGDIIHAQVFKYPP